MQVKKNSGPKKSLRRQNIYGRKATANPPPPDFTARLLAENF
jgi:hypothetical protein